MTTKAQADQATFEALLTLKGWGMLDSEGEALLKTMLDNAEEAE